MGPQGPEVVHISYIGVENGKVYFPQQQLVGDVGQILDSLVAGDWDFSEFADLKKKIDQELGRDIESDAFPVLPQRVVGSVRKVMGEEDIVALDNGMYKLWFARHYRAYAPRTLLLDNALASMGAGLPSAMAAKMVCPKRRVLAVCGDGGFMMNSQELETCVRLGLDLVVLILNDNGYGMIKWKQKGMGMKDFALDFGNPDFVKYAESYGAKGAKVKVAGEVETILKRAFDEGGVWVIEVPVDYRENDKL